MYGLGRGVRQASGSYPWTHRIRYSTDSASGSAFTRTRLLWLTGSLGLVGGLGGATYYYRDTILDEAESVKQHIQHSMQATREKYDVSQILSEYKETISRRLFGKKEAIEEKDPTKEKELTIERNMRGEKGFTKEIRPTMGGGPFREKDIQVGGDEPASNPHGLVNPEETAPVEVIQDDSSVPSSDHSMSIPAIDPGLSPLQQHIQEVLNVASTLTNPVEDEALLAKLKALQAYLEVHPVDPYLKDLVTGWLRDHQRLSDMASSTLDQSSKVHLAHLAELKASLTSQHRAELERLLGLQEKILQAKWQEDLEHQLEVEREGRLGQLHVLAEQVSQLEARLNSRDLYRNVHHLLSQLSLSLSCLKAYLKEDTSLLDEADEQLWYDLVQSVHPLTEEEKRTRLEQLGSDLQVRLRRRNEGLHLEWQRIGKLLPLLSKALDPDQDQDPSHYLHLRRSVELMRLTYSLCPLSRGGPEDHMVLQDKELKRSFQSLLGSLEATQYLFLPYGTAKDHFTSYLLAKLFTFRKGGVVPGTDLDAVLSRTKVWLDQGNLELALKEVLGLIQSSQRKDKEDIPSRESHWNHLLLNDWCHQVRRRLEVDQAIQIFSSELTHFFSRQGY